MNVLILGNGGRENALARKAYNSSLTKKVYVAPGNEGMEDNLIKVNDFDTENFTLLENFCIENDISLIIVGNEKYLDLGVVDYFNKTDIKIFGPTKEASKIETSKDFAKNIMNKYGVDTAKHYTYDNLESALSHLDNSTFPVVIKQDGLALGKGVLVSNDYDEAKSFLIDSFKTNEKVIFEEFLEGKEFSLLCFVNGDTFYDMLPVRDYKRAFDDDKGLNTGGMGAYSPVEYVTDEDIAFTVNEVIKKTVNGLSKEGIFYKGILYAGLIKTKDGIKVIEFNARFGDPETEVLMEKMESDLIEVILSVLENKTYSIKWKDGVTLGVCMATKGYPSAYEKGYEVIIPEDTNYYSMALNKQNEKYYTNGGRVLFVTSSGEDFDSVRNKVYFDIQNIKSDGLFYRKDIGKI